MVLPPWRTSRAAEVVPGGARDAERRDARVAEEARVLRGEHGVDDVARQRGEMHRQALAQLGVVIGVEEGTAEGHGGVGGERPAVDAQRAHAAAREVDVEHAAADRVGGACIVASAGRSTTVSPSGPWSKLARL